MRTDSISCKAWKVTGEYMKKNTKVIIGITLLIVFLAAGLTVILLLPSDDVITDNISESADIFLVNKSQTVVDEVTIKNDGGEYQILGYDYSKTLAPNEKEDIPLVYTMQGYENTLLSKYMTDNLVKECRTVAATRVVDRSGKKYADYGLDKPRAEVKAVYSDSSKAEMYFGDEAPDKSGTYCRIDGDKNVYLVNSGSIDMFFVDKLQMFDKNLTGELSDTDKILNIDISCKSYEKPVAISTQKNDVLMGEHIMTSPFLEVCNDSYTVEFATGFYGFTLSNVAAAEVKAEDIKQFGLSEPYMDINIKTDEENNVNILVSEKNGEGNFYIMCRGGNIIYRADEDEFKRYNVTYRDFLSSNIYVPDISNVNAAEIFYQNKRYDYSIERKYGLNDMYEEYITTNVYHNGKNVNYGNIINFVTDLSNIQRTEEIPETLDGYEKIFYIKLKFENSDYMLELYRDKENNTLAVVDGHIECIVDTEFVQTILDQTEKIPTEKIVEIIENS